MRASSDALDIFGKAERSGAFLIELLICDPLFMSVPVGVRRVPLTDEM
jgi:hypothetical protein